LLTIVSLTNRPARPQFRSKYKGSLCKHYRSLKIFTYSNTIRTNLILRTPVKRAVVEVELLPNSDTTNRCHPQFSVSNDILLGQLTPLSAKCTFALRVTAVLASSSSATYPGASLQSLNSPLTHQGAITTGTDF